MLESLATSDTASPKGFAIAPGIVVNNLDSLGEGRIQVRIPSRPGFEPWARLVGVGAGPSHGFFWAPQRDDEVLVAFHQDDPADAFVIGGLWNSRDKPPIGAPTDALNKRIIKTGISKAPGHEIEIDDLKQSITITTSTKQKVTIDPEKIELANMAGTVKITLDNKTQSITLDAAKSIELKAVAEIKLSAANIDIKGTALTSVSAPMVKIN